jgi:tRNA(Ile)-lysidine synthase
MSRGPKARRRPSSLDPVSPREIEVLLRPLGDFPALALAVSGGADSMALMRFTRVWLDDFRQSPRPDGTPPKIFVLTVNHGLRAEAAAEAEFVSREAARLGFPHVTLEWTGCKPKTGVQAAARAARYNLMTAFARANGCEAVVTAHQLGDQAETLFMRLARGSGLDGLAAMTVRSYWTPPGAREGVAILRPLLSVPRSRLAASLAAAGARWIEDPSNANERYERTLTRRSLGGAETPLRPEALALSARRLGRARETLEAVSFAFIQRTVRLHPAGFGEIDLAELRKAPAEIGLRTLLYMCAAFGERFGQPRLERVEAAYERLAGPAPSGFTLGGCAFAVFGSRLRAFREAGRMGNPRLVLKPGETGFWDRRFAVTAPETAPGPLTVHALGADGVRSARKLSASSGADPRSIPHRAAVTAPGFWLDGELAAAPPLAAFASPDQHAWAISCEARFVPPEPPRAA